MYVFQIKLGILNHFKPMGQQKKYRLCTQKWMPTFDCEYFDPSLYALVKNLITQKSYSPARPLVSGAGGDKTLILCTFVILYRIAPT